VTEVNHVAQLLLFATVYNRMWYAVPLIISVSFVYAATRHERAWPILDHAIRFGTWIIGFMAIVFVILYGISLWL